MEKEIYGYIYKIRNTVNEKVYIGLTTKCFDRRYSANGEGIERVYNYYVYQRKNEQYYNKHLLRSIEKYGFEAFEVIKEFDIAYSEEELKEKEKYWIKFYKSNDINYGYNRTEGGDSFLSGEDNPKYKRIKIKCDYCGKEIDKIVSRYDRAKFHYCSEECKKLGSKGKFTGEESPLYKERTTFKCCYCGKEIEKLECHTKNNQKVFCNNECRYEWQKENLKGKNNPNYGNGDKVSGMKNGRAKILICIFPDRQIIKNCLKGLAEELGVSQSLIKDILNSHEHYKPKKSYLKHLEGIIIMEEKDYLNTLKNINDDDKAS